MSDPENSKIFFRKDQCEDYGLEEYMNGYITPFWNFDPEFEINFEHPLVFTKQASTQSGTHDVFQEKVVPERSVGDWEACLNSHDILSNAQDHDSIMSREASLGIQPSSDYIESQSEENSQVPDDASDMVEASDDENALEDALNHLLQKDLNELLNQATKRVPEDQPRFLNDHVNGVMGKSSKDILKLPKLVITDYNKQVDMLCQ